MSDGMNGSVTKLAEGLREVITDAVQEGLKPVEKRLDGIERRLANIENEATPGFEVVDQGFRALGPPAEPTKSKSGAAQTSVLPMAAKDR